MNTKSIQVYSYTLECDEGKGETVEKKAAGEREVYSLKRLQRRKDLPSSVGEPQQSFVRSVVASAYSHKALEGCEGVGDKGRVCLEYVKVCQSMLEYARVCVLECVILIAPSDFIGLGKEGVVM